VSSVQNPIWAHPDRSRFHCQHVGIPRIFASSSNSWFRSIPLRPRLDRVEIVEVGSGLKVTVRFRCERHIFLARRPLGRQGGAGLGVNELSNGLVTASVGSRANHPFSIAGVIDLRKPRGCEPQAALLEIQASAVPEPSEGNWKVVAHFAQRYSCDESGRRLLGSLPKERAGESPRAQRRTLLPNVLPLPRKSSQKQDQPMAIRMSYVIEIEGTIRDQTKHKSNS
jgi:hypothetical protein